MNIAISHADADGILAVVMLLKTNVVEKVCFTSPARIIKTIGNMIYTEDIKKNLYIFDISGNKKAIAASSVFENAFWIDHHEWDENLAYVKNFDNVKVIVDSNAKSATSVAANYFCVTSKLVTYANEIDTNSDTALESERIRYIVDSFRATKNYYKMVEFAKKLAIDENEIYNPIYDKIIEERKILIKRAIEFALNNILFEKINDRNIGIVEANELLPVSKIFDNVECDIFVAIMYQNGNTKIEFRSNIENVFIIAKEFGGGGHKYASGVTLEGIIRKDYIIEKIRELLSKQNGYR